MGRSDRCLFMGNFIPFFFFWVGWFRVVMVTSIAVAALGLPIISDRIVPIVIIGMISR